MLEPTRQETFLDRHLDDWQTRLDLVLKTVRDMSVQTDPQAMVQTYIGNMGRLRRQDWGLAISRRGLKHPQVRITRSSRWAQQINPWKQKDLLPILDRGILVDLIYGNEPRIIDELVLEAGDPAAPYVEGYRSLVAIPSYDEGEALNMVIWLRPEQAGFSPQILPEAVLMTNLFGRATNNLVLSDRLREAYQAVDREMQIVADIQQSLLPAQLPAIKTMDLAVHYQTSHRAGGDYYDFFPLADGKWGIVIADVCGHGTPAAVLMAITHCLAHTGPLHTASPSEVLGYVNEHLAARYTHEGGTFVTALYAVYDPASRTITYANAGHNPPRVKRCRDGTMHLLDQAGDVPLGVLPDTSYQSAAMHLVPGDQILFYTDGIIESCNPAGEDFGTKGLDRVLVHCGATAQGLVDDVLRELRTFCEGRAADDDCTLLAAKIS